MYEKVSDQCVYLMIELGKLTGTTYKEINMIVFCIVGPLVFLSVLIYAIILYLKLKRLKLKMKAILIDSVNKTVTELDLDPDKNMLFQWYHALNVSMVEVAHYITDHDSIIVDEEGLLKPCDHFFLYDGAHQPFAGNGLVVGVDEDGRTVACDISVEAVRSKVQFLSRADILQIL